MDQLSIWLGIFWMIAMAALIAPGMLRMNQGKILRNTALWLAIILSLALIYRNFGPFGMAMQNLPVNKNVAAEETEDAPPPANERPKLGDEGEKDGQTFSPPQE